MQEPFDGETFSYSLFLVLCNRLVTCSVAITLLLVRSSVLCATFPCLLSVLLQSSHAACLAFRAHHIE